MNNFGGITRCGDSCVGSKTGMAKCEHDDTDQAPGEQVIKRWQYKRHQRLYLSQRVRSMQC